MKHIRLFIKLFGFKYCIIGRDVPEDVVGPVVAALAVVTQHFPELIVEVTDHA